MKLKQVVWTVIILTIVYGCQKKQEAELTVETPEPIEVPSIIDVSPFSYVCLPYTGSYQNHDSVIARFMRAAIEQGFEMSVPMLGVYYNSPSNTPEDGLVWEIGFEVPDSLEVAAPLVVKKWTFKKVAKAIHTGAFEAVDQTYSKIFKFIDEQDMMPAGPTMERFQSDPQQVPSEKLKTEIWVPISSK